MGLDQYALTIKPEVIGDAQVDFKFYWPHMDWRTYFDTGRAATETPGKNGEMMLAYWRKHSDLEGWMSDLYFKKGGEGYVIFGEPAFNGQAVRLTLEDLDRLEFVVKHDLLPPTTGFFFGKSGEEDKPPTLEFIERARVAILEGMAVFYVSSW